MAHRISRRPGPAALLEKKAPSGARPLVVPPHTDQAFGCLYLPQFPVWAARYTNPSPEPTLIHRGGKIQAACAGCLAKGVRVGWTLPRAQALCPEAAAVAFDAAETAHVWEALLRNLYDLTPQLESPRPGLLFFAPPATGSSGWLSFMAALSALAREWKAQVVVAPDRSTAEIAAHVVEPGCVRRIKPQREQGFLKEVGCAQLTKLGLNEETTKKLEWFGFRSVADLQVLSREQIASQFAEPGAPREAALLWRYARAGTPEADRRPVQSYRLPPVCQGRIVLEQAATCPPEWEAALWEAVQQAAAQLNGMSAGAITLSLIVKSGQRSGSKLLRENVSSPRTLLRHFRDLMDNIVEQGDEVQIIEGSLSRLVAGGIQSSLFESLRGLNLPTRECPPRLRSALRNIEGRYSGTLWRWLLRDEHAALPEERYNLVPLHECAEGSGPQ